MSTLLQPLIGEKTAVITSDGRMFIGVLKGFDQTTNLILTKCNERVYSETQGVEIIPLGLYLVRGDNIVIVGEVDEVIDVESDLTTIKAAPLKPITH